MGREARRSYDLSQVEIVPSRRTRSSKEVSTAWQLDAYRFEIPLVTHPTDAVVSPASAVAIGRLGGLAVLNAEGLWARHADPEGALARVRAAAEGRRPDGGGAAAAGAARRAAGHRAADRGAQVGARGRGHGGRPGQPAAGPRAHPGAAGRRGGDPGRAGHDHLRRARVRRASRSTSRSSSPRSTCRWSPAGCGDYRTAMHLMRTGAAGVIVGYGESSATTTDDVLGIGVPMATAIVDAAAARRDYLDETGGRYVHVIADGGMVGSGEMAKAIACGADAVMLGEQLAEASDAPGRGLYWTSRGRAPVAAALRGHRVRARRLEPGAGAVRPGGQPVRRGEPVRRAAPGDGQDRLQRPQGVPAGRADRPRLTRVRSSCTWLAVAETDAGSATYRRRGEQVLSAAVRRCGSCFGTPGRARCTGPAGVAGQPAAGAACRTTTRPMRARHARSTRSSARRAPSRSTSTEARRGCGRAVVVAHRYRPGEARPTAGRPTALADGAGRRSYAQRPGRRPQNVPVGSPRASRRDGRPDRWVANGRGPPARVRAGGARGAGPVRRAPPGRRAIASAVRERTTPGVLRRSGRRQVHPGVVIAPRLRPGIPRRARSGASPARWRTGRRGRGRPCPWTG